MAFVPNDVNKSLCKWRDLFISAVDEQILHCTKTMGDHPRIDSELLALVKKKNNQR